MERDRALRLTEYEAKGLRDALEAEHRSRLEAEAAIGQFGPVPVLVHLGASADRHRGIFTELLHSGGFDDPLVPSVVAGSHTTLAAALEAAFDDETRKAQLYDRLLNGCSQPELRQVLFSLWQSTASRHRAALAHRLRVEQDEPER